MDRKTYRIAKATLKVGKILHLLLVLPFAFCIFGFFLTKDIEAIICAVCVALIHALLIVLEVLAYCFLYKGKRIYRNPLLEMNRRRYIGFPYCEVKDYKKELELVRENYRKDLRNGKNQIPYVEVPDFQTLYEYKTLVTGEIYYGYLVMANSALFDTSSKYMLMPGVFLFSADEYYEENPLELEKIALALYENRENNFLKDEESYEKNVLIDEALTEGRKVYASSILMYRPHLPFGYLSGKLLPVIANLEANTSTFVVDVQYWSPTLIANFAKNDDLNERILYELKHFAYHKNAKANDYRQELSAMQEKYLQSFKEGGAEKELLFEEYALPKLLYSYIVDVKKKFNQAFSRDYDFPAVALYSEDEYYKENPHELKKIAEKIYESTGGRRLVQEIIDFRKHTYNTFTLPLELTAGREVLITSVFIPRLALPRCFLNSRILPVIKFPEEGVKIVALPKGFWSEAFLAEFVESQEDIGKEVREKFPLN